ncbi:MAG: hypothetical protein HY782_16500 [Chloroflexi bacterium]|nr:hypothetical protein [Chloroflexota bacterium]
MRNGIVLVGIAFAATFAVVVGNRLSDEAMAVVVGAICGISASIPVSIGFVIAASRHWGRDDRGGDAPGRGYDEPRPYAQPQPPVIVISPPQQNQSPYQYPAAPYYLPASNGDAPLGAREFKIIGDE